MAVTTAAAVLAALCLLTYATRLRRLTAGVHQRPRERPHERRTLGP